MKAVATNIISHKFSSNSSVFYHSHDRGTAAQSRVARSPCVRDRANATASAPLSWRVPGHGVPSAQPHRRRGLHQHEDLLVRAPHPAVCRRCQATPYPCVVPRGMYAGANAMVKYKTR
jgi:hypothetical protein